jgi:hypothetical protein
MSTLTKIDGPRPAHRQHTETRTDENTGKINEGRKKARIRRMDETDGNGLRKRESR